MTTNELTSPEAVEKLAAQYDDLGHVSESGETLALEIRALPLTEETSDAE